MLSFHTSSPLHRLLASPRVVLALCAPEMVNIWVYAVRRSCRSVLWMRQIGGFQQGRALRFTQRFHSRSPCLASRYGDTTAPFRLTVACAQRINPRRNSSAASFATSASNDGSVHSIQNPQNRWIGCNFGEMREQFVILFEIRFAGDQQIPESKDPVSACAT